MFSISEWCNGWWKRHLLESAGKHSGRAFPKLKRWGSRWTLRKKGLNSETLKRRCSCWFQDLLHPLFFRRSIKDKSSLDSARKPCISMRITRRSQIEKTWSTDLQLNHPSCPPKPTEYGIVCPKKYNTKNRDLGVYYCICLIFVYTSFVDDTSFSNRL